MVLDPVKGALSIDVVTPPEEGVDQGIGTRWSMMALMADGGAHNGWPVANKKHDEWVVVHIVVNIALGQAVYDEE